MSRAGSKSRRLMARMLFRPINWAVERYFQTGIFFGNSVLKGFEEFSTVDGKARAETAAAGFLISRAFQEGVPGFSVSMPDISLNGVPAGSWKLTIERTAEPE